MESNILVIDEGNGEGESLASALRLAGLGAEGAGPDAGAIRKMSAMALNLLILVLDDGRSDAIAFATTIARVHGVPVLVLVNGSAEGLPRRLAEIRHVKDVLRRPVPRPWLMAAIDRCIMASPASAR